MGDTVRLRPNHYEMLGLTPAASADEIAQAFTRQLGLLPVRPFGWLTQVSVAHETLRDPAKRKAYDAALFPKSAGAPPPQPASPHPVFAQLFRRAPAAETAKQASPAETAKPAAVAIPLPAAPPPRPIEEWKPAPLAAFTFKEPKPPAIESPPAPAMKPEELVRQAIGEQRGRDVPAPVRPPLDRDLPESAAPDSEPSIDWKLPALAAGAVILAVAGGAWAGVEVGNDNEKVQPDRIATLRVPPAKPAPAVEASPFAAPPAATDLAEAQPVHGTRYRLAPVERARPPLEIHLPEVQPVEIAQLDQAQPDAADPPVADAPGGTAPAAKLPLPNTVIARTIHRIGYGCGQVASTAAIDGAEAGVFKVTCTSGQSYRAAPVRGRYRFSRMGSR